MSKHPLQEAIEYSGEFSCRSYSGRAMYGRKCLGVIVKRDQDIGDLLSAIVGRVDEDNQGEIEDGVRSFRMDNMGLDTIVYFQDVPYSEEDDDNLDEECPECGAAPGEACSTDCALANA